jgi:hypothetical protein
MDDITAYSDAQVGGAGRVLHEGCKAVLIEHFGIRPMREEGEGSKITIPTGYAPDDYRLVGKIAGEAPFTGTLVHHGGRGVGEAAVPAEGKRRPTAGDSSRRGRTSINGGTHGRDRRNRPSHVRQDIADYLGLTIKTISRMLRLEATRNRSRHLSGKPPAHYSNQLENSETTACLTRADATPARAGAESLSRQPD